MTVGVVYALLSRNVFGPRKDPFFNALLDFQGSPFQ